MLYNIQREPCPLKIIVISHRLFDHSFLTTIAGSPLTILNKAQHFITDIFINKGPFTLSLNTCFRNENFPKCEDIDYNSFFEG